jgi:hypothetical protein
VSPQKAKRLRLAIASLRLSESDTGATDVPDQCDTVVLGRASVQLQIGNGKGGGPCLGSILARQQDHFVGEVQRDLRQQKIRVLDRLAIDGVAVPVLTGERRRVVGIDVQLRAKGPVPLFVLFIARIPDFLSAPLCVSGPNTKLTGPSLMLRRQTKGEAARRASARAATTRLRQPFAARACSMAYSGASSTSISANRSRLQPKAG